MPTNLSGQRWRAARDLTIERRNESPLTFAAGDEIVGAPDNWPPRSVVDLEWVVPVDEPIAGPPPVEPAADGKGDQK